MSHANPPLPPSPERQVEQRFDAVGALVLESEGRFRPYCSGVFIGAYFATAAHCVIGMGGLVATEVEVATHRDFDDEQARFTRSWTYLTVVVWDDEDVAILRPSGAASRISHGTVELAHSDLRRGDAVEVYGHPRGYLYYFARGQVVTPLRYIGEQPFTLINAPAYPGMSGGPIFNEDGEVVGLVSFGWWGQSHIQGTVTRESIERALLRVTVNRNS